MLFLLPNLAWLILAVELFERFAYYGAVFTFTTFTLVMLDSSVPLSNAVVNVVFILSPLAAVAASCVADGPWGRPRTLARSALVYSLGLCLVFASALPAMYASFPDGPTWYARALFGVGLVALGLGYGGVKTCSAPLLGEVLADAAAAQQRGAQGGGESTEQRVMSISTGFTIYFWIANCGALAGTLGTPFLRAVAGPKRMDADGDETTTGYFVSYGVCAVGVTTATCVFFACHHLFNLRSEKANVGRMLLIVFHMAKDILLGLPRALQRLCRRRDEGETVALATESDDTPLISAEESRVRREVVAALGAAKLFAILPLYWLIQNQGLSNVVVQAGAVERPAYFPPEIYNNVSTVALLLLLPVANWVARRVWGDRPPYKGRMLVGIAAAVLEIAYSAAVQVLIDRRGTLDAKGNFTPHAGQTALSGWVLIPTYVLNGAASAFVDPTSLEAAFVLAPARTKSFVMALYLFASSAAGFLGLLFTPLAVPSRFTVMFGVMGGLLTVGAVVWAFLVPNPSVSVAEDTAENNTTSSDISIKQKTAPLNALDST